MKRAHVFCLFPFLTVALLLSQSNPGLHRTPAKPNSPSDPKAQAGVVASYSKLPLSFEENHGQANAQVRFLSHIAGYTLFLTSDEAVLALSTKKTKTPVPNGATVKDTTTRDRIKSPVETRPAASPAGTTTALRLKLRNASAAAKITGVDEFSGKNNYFIGNDPKRWQTNVPTYAKVKYEKIYPGIDLVYYGNQRQLEYDFIVSPGAEPSRISFDVTGAQRITQDARGDLVFKMHTADDEIRWHKPIVYQEKDGSRREIAASYAITATNRITFELDNYDATLPLYIDPLIYSTYLGGSSGDIGSSIAANASDIHLKESEQKALADQALADFAAKEGIALPSSSTEGESAQAEPPAKSMGPVSQ